jgi:hypothetical protein
MEHSNDPLHSSGSSTPEGSEKKPSLEDWKPSPGIYVAFLTLCVITLMVALDGTSLSVALPVSIKCNPPYVTMSAS